MTRLSDKITKELIQLEHCYGRDYETYAELQRSKSVAMDRYKMEAVFRNKIDTYSHYIMNVVREHIED